jgi:hypothetical protein
LIVPPTLVNTLLKEKMGKANEICILRAIEETEDGIKEQDFPVGLSILLANDVGLGRFPQAIRRFGGSSG